MSDITLLPADLAVMTVAQLAALPSHQKVEIDRNLNEAQSFLKQVRTKFDAAMNQAYGQQARAALRESGRDFGTTYVNDGPLQQALVALVPVAIHLMLQLFSLKRDGSNALGQFRSNRVAGLLAAT